MNWQKVMKRLKDQGWTQEALADKTGISQCNLSQINTGQRKDVLWETGNKLLKLLNE